MTAPRIDIAADDAPHAADRLATVSWAATVGWVVGMCTLFPLGNEQLEAVSIFTFDRLAFLIAVPLFALVVARNPATLRQLGRTEAVMALFLGLVLVSWGLTLPGKDTVTIKRDAELFLTGLLMPYTAFLIARHSPWTRRQVRIALCATIAGIGLFMIALGLVQGLVDWRFLVRPSGIDTHPFRARGPFQNATPYALLLSLLVPVTIAWRAATHGRGARLALALLIAGLLEALLLSKIRVAWLAVPAAACFLAWRCVPARPAAAATAVAMLALVGLAAFGIDLGRMVRAYPPDATISQRLIDSGPIYNRVAVYATSLNMIVHRPVFGWGFGARTFVDFRQLYFASCCGVSTEWAEICVVPHNEILNVLVLLGAVGLALYLLLLRELWRLLAARRAGPDPLSAALAVGLQAGFIAVAISAQMHDVMYLTAVQMTFFFLAGLIAPAAAVAGARSAPPENLARSG